MSDLQSMRTRIIQVLIASLFVCLPALASGPQADVPIPRPLFTIDSGSPTASIPGPIQAASILSAPGPAVFYPAAGLSLTGTDELDDFSFNRNDVATTDKFVLLFNVDRSTVGGAGAILSGRPYNVMEQAAKHQAAGDVFMTIDGYDRTHGPFLRVVVKNNTLVGNQGDAGGVDYDLSPDVSPYLSDPAPVIDGMDGMGYPPPAFLESVVLTTNYPVYFTLRTGSPSLAHLPPPASGASIYYDANPNSGGGETLYASPSQLGLGQNEDIDGLIVFDFGIVGTFEPNIDQVLFSLTRNSPSVIGGIYSAADILSSNGVGPPTVLATALDLGLLGTDNVRGLELLKTNFPSQTAYDSSIKYVLPDDWDGDNALTPIDCQHFASCYSGPGVPDSGPPCDAYDQDADGDVDCTDWINLQLAYRQFNGGISCPLLGIPEFVAALLGTPILPAHTCEADINLDGKTDGKDISAYVHVYLGP